MNIYFDNAKRVKRISLITLFAFTVCSMSAHTVVGKVTNTNGEPLAGAHVMAHNYKNEQNMTTITESDGQYRLNIPENGKYDIEVSFLGYLPQKFNLTVPKDSVHYNYTNGDLQRVNVKLVEDPTTLDQIVVTATMTPKQLKEVPVVTRLITAGDIAKADATNVQDLLTQELPGLEFGFAMSQETSLNMSGFGGNAVLFLVDGERLAGETMDNTDYNRLNLDDAGRIEIVKGASSALYGSNAVGGVVNIITKENTKPWAVNVNSRFSSMGSEWRNGANISLHRNKVTSQTSFQHTHVNPIDLPSGPTAEEKALAALLGETIQEDKSNIKRLYGNLTCNVKERLTYKANEHLKLVARGGYFYRESQRETYEYHYNAYSGGFKGKYDWKNGRNLELSYAFDQYEKANYQPDGTRTHDHDYTNRQHAAHLLFNQPLRANTLTLGADFLNDYLTTYQFLDNSAHSQNNVDVFAQFDFNPTKRLNLVGSARYDYFSASSAQAVTARLAAMYKWNRLSLRTSYAGGFRAPSLKEMYMHYDMGNMGYIICGNPEVEPEKSNNFNIALEHDGKISKDNWLAGSYNITLMGYCNLFDKRITSVGKYWVVDPSVRPEGGFQVEYNDNHIIKNDDGSYSYIADGGQTYVAQTSSLYWNEDGVNVTGIDLSAQYQLKNGFGLRYNYAFMHESGNVVDSQFTQPRSHSMTWRASYDRQICDKYGLNISLSGRWLGKPQSGREDVDQGYTLWKLMVQQRILSGVNLNVSLDNLFNYKPDAYYYCSPMTTGTAWSVGLSIDLDRLCKEKLQ